MNKVPSPHKNHIMGGPKLSADDLQNESLTRDGIEGYPYLHKNYANLIDTRFYPSNGTFWIIWNPKPRPCFTLEMLKTYMEVGNYLEKVNGFIEFETIKYKIQYVILASATPGIFNLGGDLDLFLKLIRESDKEKIVHYAESCINALYLTYSGFNLHIATIALVQGNALGGGFEASLSCDYLIAEEKSRFGFPEIMFNLFPGMGAYSFLSRIVGHKKALQMMHSPRDYSASEMKAEQIVDVVAENGKGVNAVFDFVHQRRSKLNGQSSGPYIKKLVQNIPYKELIDITHYWAECVINLSEKDIKSLTMLLYKQNKLIAKY